MENLKIKIIINKIDTSSLGDWGDEDLDTVASRYQQFLADRFVASAKSAYPDAEIYVKLSNNLSSRSYSVSVSNEVDNFEILENLETDFADDNANAWDIFCAQ